MADDFGRVLRMDAVGRRSYASRDSALGVVARSACLVEVSFGEGKQDGNSRRRDWLELLFFPMRLLRLP